MKPRNRLWLMASALVAMALSLGYLVAQQQNAGTGADGVANTSLSFQQVSGDVLLRIPVEAGYYFNGAAWDRRRSASATNLTLSASLGSTLTEKGARWQVVSTPAVSLQASASRAAGGTGIRHIADCVTFSGGSTTALALTKLTVNLRDGATGAGTIIHSWTVVVPATTGQNITPFTECGLGLVGSANTAMTLEFSALLLNLFEDVSLTGYDVN